MGQQTDTPKDCRTKGGANSSEPPLFSPQDIRRFEEIHAQAPHLYPPHMDSRMSGQNAATVHAHAFAAWMAGFTQPPQPDFSAESTWRLQFPREMEQMGAMLRASQHENARLRMEIQEIRKCVVTPGFHNPEEDGPAGRQASTKEDGPAGRKALKEDGLAGRQASIEEDGSAGQLATSKEGGPAGRQASNEEWEDGPAGRQVPKYEDGPEGRQGNFMNGASTGHQKERKEDGARAQQEREREGFFN